MDADISALSPSGERFSTATSAYVVKNVDKVFLTLEVMVGLRIVDKQFPTAGAEQNNRVLKRLVSSVSYMSPSNFKMVMTIFMAAQNFVRRITNDDGTPGE